MKQIMHRVAAGIAFFCIASFFTSTLVVELFCSHAAVAQVKSLILLPGIPILVLAMIITGSCGFALSRSRKGKLIEAKQRRMPFIVANGILILIPCAIVLESLAAVGTFNRVFYSVQVIEIVAGFINLILMSMSIRDGLKLSGRLKKRRINK